MDVRRDFSPDETARVHAAANDLRRLVRTGETLEYLSIELVELVVEQATPPYAGLDQVWYDNGSESRAKYVRVSGAEEPIAVPTEVQDDEILGYLYSLLRAVVPILDRAEEGERQKFRERTEQLFRGSHDRSASQIWRNGHDLSERLRALTSGKGMTSKAVWDLKQWLSVQDNPGLRSIFIDESVEDVTAKITAAIDELPQTKEVILLRYSLGLEGLVRHDGTLGARRKEFMALDESYTRVTSTFQQWEWNALRQLGGLLVAKYGH